ncbi:hypothetical protein C8J55DRAFT_515612 [Lentinula edodes]|uniref:Uncharacterized protein n=1 Tax=Lentinula lateritia TaxID=40482 RepID=A0A9W9A9R9_9AGAR|nr:hypothetical protein C8J55DRAFT_515612 [Lentinula edodes]
MHSFLATTDVESTQARPLRSSPVFLIHFVFGLGARTHSSLFKGKNWHVDDLEHSELYPISLQSFS